MYQFLTGSDADYLTLEKMAKGKCIRFKDQDMPPGARPPKAHVGFEINKKTQNAKLLVSRGVSYQGENSSVLAWIQQGEKTFSDFGSLKKWIKVELAGVYEVVNNSEITAEDSGLPIRQTSESLTDLSSVKARLRQSEGVYLDEDDLLIRLKRYVIGQDNALKTLAAMIVRHLAHIRPLSPAVIFAIGPSGVGKTRTAKAAFQVLREVCDENNRYQFLRLDMSEYQESHRVSQLIGAPQGYVGHGEGSQLVNTLRANPCTIVLFDEIEKAHPSILRVLMNAMDAGRLSTASCSLTGHQVDCRYAIFMFTSNLDAKSILDELDSRNAYGNRVIEDEVCRRRLHAAGIAPEIVGRIGRFLVYQHITEDTRADILTLAISEVAGEYGLQIAHIEPDVIVELLRKVRSQNFGVRPERFLIDDLLGGAFVKAAKQGYMDSIAIDGPPFVCKVQHTK